MVNLSQRNPRWSSLRLGSSKLTVGRYGCTTTCISMLSDYFKCFKNPGEIASQKDWYTTGKDAGLVVWGNIKFPHMEFMYREYKENPVSIEHCLTNPNKAVLLQVNDGAHWVVGVRKAYVGNDWLVVDPWDGKKKWAKKAYHNVTGAAYFGKK